MLNKQKLYKKQIIIFTCKLEWHPSSSKDFTTESWHLLTAICKGVCCLQLRAFMSAPAAAKRSITAF